MWASGWCAGWKTRVIKSPGWEIIQRVSWMQAVKFTLQIPCSHLKAKYRSKRRSVSGWVDGRQFCIRVCPSVPQTRLLLASPAPMGNKCCSQLILLSPPANSPLLGEASTPPCCPALREGFCSTEKDLSPEETEPVAPPQLPFWLFQAWPNRGGRMRLLCVPLSSVAVCLCQVSWCHTKGKGSTHTHRGNVLWSEIPWVSVSVLTWACSVCPWREAWDSGEKWPRGGVNVALRGLIILLLLGSVLGEAGGWGTLDLMSSSINSHLHTHTQTHTKQ